MLLWTDLIRSVRLEGKWPVRIADWGTVVVVALLWWGIREGEVASAQLGMRGAMLRRVAHCLATIAVVFIVGIVPSFATETWFNQRVTWKYGKEGLEWKTVIRNAGGRGEYQLSLSPLWALEGGVIAMEIVVALPAQPNVNLLGDRQNDVQYPFVITVEELQKGIAKSKFGTVRNFQIGNIVLHVTIENYRLGRGVGSGSTFCKDCRNIQELSTRIVVESKAP